MANRFSRWIARRIYKSLVKTDLKNPKFKNINNSKDLAKHIFRLHDKVYKKYDITFVEVQSVIEECLRNKKGLMAKVVLSQGRKSIRKAIKEQRIVFLSKDLIRYIDKNSEVFNYTFDEMAHRCIDNVGQRENIFLYLGITDLDFREILDNEYKKTIGGK